MPPSRRRFVTAHATRSADPAAEAPANLVSPWVQLRSASNHPFIFQRMVQRADSAARPGDVVQIYDKSGRLFGRGLYNPRSQIVLRVLTHDEQPVDDTFWRGRLQQAVELRRRLGLDEITDAQRLVHAEGDGLSGLIVERYADWLVAEVFSLGMFQRWPQISAALSEVLGPPTSLDRPHRAEESWKTLLRADDRTEELEGFRADPPREHTPPRLIIREHGIRYQVDIAAGHKTGFFCDQRENRRQFAAYCRDADVLDVCCYTAGFGLNARLLGCARNVTSVDLDEEALKLARENANLNQTRIDIVHADAFVYLRQMIANQRRYDAVVLDPPKLAIGRQELEQALRKYGDLNELAIRVVKPGGVLLTCSCSGLVPRDEFMRAVHYAGRRAGRNLQLFDFRGAAADHPVMLNCPESEYLKAAWLRVL